SMQTAFTGGGRVHGLGDLAPISPVRPRASGDPSLPISARDPWVPACAGTNEVACPAALLFKNQSRSAPVVGWARGFARIPVSFLPPSRGGWRAERRMFRISPERPGSRRATRKRRV